MSTIVEAAPTAATVISHTPWWRGKIVQVAAIVAVMLTVQLPFVTPDFALKETIVVLVGVVVGGIDRLWTATLGGFAIGFASGVINGALPTDKTVFLPSVLFALVIGVLLLRPAGLFARERATVVDRV